MGTSTIYYDSTKVHTNSLVIYPQTFVYFRNGKVWQRRPAWQQLLEQLWKEIPRREYSLVMFWVLDWGLLVQISSNGKFSSSVFINFALSLITTMPHCIISRVCVCGCGSATWVLWWNSDTFGICDVLIGIWMYIKLFTITRGKTFPYVKKLVHVCGNSVLTVCMCVLSINRFLHKSLMLQK